MDIRQLNQETWDRLLQRREQLPHALLLSGTDGCGLQDLAQTFVHGLLCESASRESGLPCGQCLACGWLSQGNHPDLRVVTPASQDEETETGAETKKKSSQQITIDQIRSLDEFLNVGTHRKGLRIILLAPAEAMNRNTANALLKMLEEPPAGTLFLLVSYDSARLLPTIRSRCQVIQISLPSRALSQAYLASRGVDRASHWLDLAGGAPLEALKLAQEGEPAWLQALLNGLVQGGGVNPLQSAAMVNQKLKESKDPLVLRQVVTYTQKWAMDLALCCAGQPSRYFVRQGDTMGKLVTGVSSRGIAAYFRQLTKSRRDTEQPLNSLLFLEDFFLRYKVLFKN